MTAPRNTTTRDRHRAVIRRGKPPCSLCGGDIDYSLRYPHPMSFVVDHIIPLNRGGLDRADNCQPSHRSCNRTKSDKLPGDDQPPAPREYVTWRTW